MGLIKEATVLARLKAVAEADICVGTGSDLPNIAMSTTGDVSMGLIASSFRGANVVGPLFYLPTINFELAAII
jgi:hypothetical protein